MSYLAHYASWRLKIPQQEIEGLRGDKTLAGRSITGTLATRSKGSTRTLDPARLILLDDAEMEEGGVGDSINTDGEDCTIWLEVDEVSQENGVESEGTEDEGKFATWDDRIRKMD